MANLQTTIIGYKADIVIELSESFGTAIIKEIMGVYQATNMPAVLKLRKAINEHINIDGFRQGKASKASPSNAPTYFALARDR